MLCCVGGKPSTMLSTSPHTNQSARPAPSREGARRASCSKHSLRVTAGSDPMIRRKSTLNLNVNTEIEDVRLFSGMTSAFLFVLAGSLYITHSPLLSKTKQERKDS